MPSLPGPTSIKVSKLLNRLQLSPFHEEFAVTHSSSRKSSIDSIGSGGGGSRRRALSSDEGAPGGSGGGGGGSAGAGAGVYSRSKTVQIEHQARADALSAAQPPVVLAHTAQKQAAEEGGWVGSTIPPGAGAGSGVSSPSSPMGSIGSPGLQDSSVTSSNPASPLQQQQQGHLNQGKQQQQHQQQQHHTHRTRGTIARLANEMGQ